MSPIDNVLAAIRKAGTEPKKCPNGYEAKCPAHDDKHASLSVSVGEGGKVVLCCHAGCASDAVVASLGMSMSDLFPAAKPKDRLVATYAYTDESGVPLYEVQRYEPKTFRQRRADGSWTLGDTRRVLYRLPSVRAAVESGATIWIAEGEKDVDNLVALGLVATCNSGGVGGSWKPEYTQSMKGAADVVIVADKDEQGRKHASKIMAALTGSVRSVRIIEMPGDNVKDVSDWLAAGGTREQLEKLAVVAEPKPRFEFQSGVDLVNEEIKALPWLVNGVIPDCGVCVFSGEPKAAKTWAVIEAAMGVATGTLVFGEFVVPRARAVALFLVEDSKLSVQARIRGLAASREMPMHEAAARMHFVCRGHVDILNKADLQELAAACKSIPDLGMLVLDPLRDIHFVDENDSASMKRVTDALRWLRDQLSCSVVFVHHASKSGESTRDRRPGQRMRGSGAIHGAIDAGFYMTETQTDSSTYWENKVFVEVKEGAGAGIFKLTLNVDNDEEGHALGCRWDKEDVEGKESRKDEHRDTVRSRIIGVLQKSKTSISLRSITKEAKTHHRLAKSILDEAVSDNIAHQSSGGWIYGPKPSVSGVSSVSSGHAGHGGVSGVSTPYREGHARRTCVHNTNEQEKEEPPQTHSGLSDAMRQQLRSVSFDSNEVNNEIED